MNNRLQTIERILKKRHRVQQSQISIREILVHEILDYDNKHYWGEFNRQNRESSSSLVARMIKYISDLALLSVRVHIADVFQRPEDYLGPEDEVYFNKYDNTEAAKDYLREDGLNAITRLSFNEFSFYPSHEYGPLSYADFTNLLENLDTLAATLPDNFHILIATMPVKLADNNVHNMRVYIECGKQVVIHPFTKANPSSSDPLYPNTTNINYSAKPPSAAWIHLLDKTLKIARINFQRRQLSAASIVEIQNILKASETHQPPKKLLRAGNKLIKSLQNREVSGEDEIIDYFEFVNNFYELLKEEAESAITAVPSAALLPKSSEAKGTALYYGGEFTCKTAGGAQLEVVIDICLDQFLAVGLTQLQNKMQLARQKGQDQVSRTVSHMITSNSIRITPKNIVSHTVTQIDPLLSLDKNTVYAEDRVLEAESSGVISRPAFGSYAEANVYPRMIVSNDTFQFNPKLEDDQEFVMQLKALHFDRAQHPKDSDQLNAQIDSLILRPLFALVSPRCAERLRQATSREQLIDLLDELATSNQQDHAIETQKTLVAAQKIVAAEIDIAKSLLSIELEDDKRLKQLYKQQQRDEKLTAELLRVANALEIEESFSRDVAVGECSAQLFANPKRQACAVIEYDHPAICLTENHLLTNENHIVEESVASASASKAFPSLAPLMLFVGFFAHYLPFNGSKEKLRPLTMEDKLSLKQDLLNLYALNAAFQQKKQKRAYVYGVNRDQYNSVAVLLEDTRLAILDMVKKNSASVASLETVHKNILSIQANLKQLTNKDLEKALRYQEVRAYRQVKHKA